MDSNFNYYDYDASDEYDNIFKFYNIEYDKDGNVILVKQSNSLVYNENNTLIEKSDVEKIINKYVKNKVKVKDIKLYRIATTHISYTKCVYEKIDSKKNI